MGKTTKIEWCDSTVNPSMGCNGCELWNRKEGVLHCYAGTLTDRYGGKNSGFPKVFEEPAAFRGRVDEALKWPDLTGTDRKDKPWLNGLPRLVFVGDMGDTFTETLWNSAAYQDWIMGEFSLMASSPHQWLVLTKRPKHLAELSQMMDGLPENIWPGTTVTQQSNADWRVPQLLEVRGGGVKWLSCEPLLGELHLHQYLASEVHHHRDNDVTNRDVLTAVNSIGCSYVDWIIGGGESGIDARECNLDHLESLASQCSTAGIPYFNKQLGAKPIVFDDGGITGNETYAPYKCKDKSGKNWAEWPDAIKIREVPQRCHTDPNVDRSVSQ